MAQPIAESAVKSTMQSLALVTVGRWVDARQGGVTLVSPDGTRGFLEEGHGIAFMLGDRRSFVTCAHVVKHRDQSEVVVYPASRGEPACRPCDVQTLIRGRNFDIAVLRLVEPVDDREPLKPSESNPHLGTELFFYSPVVSWRRDDKLRSVAYCLRRSLASGYEDMLRLVPDAIIPREMLIDAMVPRGSSGSPLVRRDGRLCGMVFAEEMRPSVEIAIPTGIGRAIPVATILAAVKEMGEIEKGRATDSSRNAGCQ